MRFSKCLPPLAALLLTFIVRADEPVPLENFKVGDAVEIPWGGPGKWLPCTVSKAFYAGGYDLACGDMPLRAKGDSAHIRARTASATEKQQNAKMAAAVANRPDGSFGTRNPKTCANRSSINPALATQYFICDAEGVQMDNMILVSNVKVQLGPSRAFIYTQDSALSGIDVKQPVYAIRGGFDRYVCSRTYARTDTAFQQTHNCILYHEPHAEGSCYKNTWGEWHCTMVDRSASAWGQRDQSPPPAN